MALDFRYSTKELFATLALSTCETGKHEYVLFSIEECLTSMTKLCKSE